MFPSTNKYCFVVLLLTLTLYLDTLSVRGDDSPLYPITASWFQDRFTAAEWNHTLSEFAAIGGDTVLLQAPALTIRNKEDIQRDPSFYWCGSLKSPTGADGTDCVTEAETDLKAAGLVIVAWMTYMYEENFSENIMTCKKYDRMLNSSRIYYRLVIPLNGSDCSFGRGTEVAVVFTMFSGIDPHALLLNEANKNNISVYFSLPSAPLDPGQRAEGFLNFNSTLMPVYYNFVSRILLDHQTRFRGLYHTIKGYYSADDTCLATLLVPLPPGVYPAISLYSMLNKIVKKYKKQFVLSPFIILNRQPALWTLQDHIIGFEALARLGADIIAVKEGRGAGRSAYFWDTQTDTQIAKVDPKLLRILQYKNSSVKDTSTFKDQFVGSVNELFRLFAESRHKLKTNGTQFDFWLNIDAFEYLRDDPCLPLDHKGSGMSQMLDRTTKGTLDWALTAAGSRIQKVSSFAWDPDFTCKTKKYRGSLASEIRRDHDRAIISECRWNSPQNMSVAVIGYNLGDDFEVHWPDTHGKTRVEKIGGSFFYMDYGILNDRTRGLVYIMLYNLSDLTVLREHGHIIVKAIGSFHSCHFTY